MYLKKLLFAVVILFFFLEDSTAQVPDYQLDYQPLTSEGTLPSAVTTPSSRKYKKQLNRIRKNEKKSDKKLKKNFFLQSNFIIDDLLQSGYIVKIWREAKVEGKERQERKVYYNTTGKEEYEKYLKNKAKNGIRLGIDKIVMVNPA